MNLPSLICFIMLLSGLFLPVRFLLALSMALGSFGSLAVIPTELTGGTSILAGTAATVFIVIKVLLSRGGAGGVISASLDARRLGLLTAFTLIAVVGALILPICFSGSIDAYPLRTTHLISIPEPIVPTTANFTQASYLVLSLLSACSYCWLATSEQFVDDFGKALIIGATVAVATGVLDIVTNILGISDFLSIFRTASYAFITGAEVQGVKRVIGLMPEASSFGGLTVSYFSTLLYTRNAFPPAIRQRIVIPLMVACGGFAVLSTSSTAYAALLVTLAVFMLDGSRRLFFGQAAERSRASKELIFIFVAIVGLLLGSMVLEETRTTLIAIFDQMVLQKTQSLSYIERSSWTRAAFEAWEATAGLGVGVGSVRTSNLFINILASTGFLGFAFFAAFLVKVFASRLSVNNARLAALGFGLKLTLIPALVGASLAGTTPDYGSGAGALFGIIVSASLAGLRKLRNQRTADRAHPLRVT